MTCSEVALGVGNGKIHIYKPDGAKNYPAILIIPGGAYWSVCDETDGEPVAFEYASRGFVCAVMYYSVAEAAPKNCPLAEASAAMAYLRRNADELGIDKERVYTIGFSAGGHLSGSLATLWHREEIIKKAGIEYGENKPTASIMCFPVVSAFEAPHLESFGNLLGKSAPTEEELEYYSLEKHVDSRSAPVFITHTAEDELVPVQNGIAMARAYADAGVQFELHVYPHGPHGLVLANEITALGKPDFVQPQFARFIDDSIYFFNHLK